MRINRASDDAAGLAVSESLRVDSRVYEQAVRNANDGISSLNIADSALEEMKNILYRLSSLAEQSANGVFTFTQRKSLDEEANQLVQEYNRIIATTEFNSTQLLVGDQSATTLQLGYGSNESISFTLGEEASRNVADGTYQTAIDVNTVNGGTDAALADFNNDGIMDMVVVNSTGNVSVMRGDGDGTFTNSSFTIQEFGVETAESVATGDFNNDGYADIAIGISSGNVEIRLGTGSGFSSGQLSSITGGSIEGLEVGDFDSDGNLDVLAHSGANVYFAAGDGSDGLSSGTDVSGANPTSIGLSTGDFNGDGILDFTLGGSTADQIEVQFGNGDGTFSGEQLLTSAGKGYVAVAGDLDHDGDDDLIAFNVSGGATSIFLSNGDGTFADRVDLDSSNYVGRDTQVVDMNGDGILDLVGYQSGTNSTLVTAYGNGDGTFQDYVSASTTSSTSLLVVADFDGDGALDVSTHTSNDVDVHISNTDQVTTLGRLNLLTVDDALEAFDAVDEALDRISAEQGVIGANMSRLSIAVANLGSIVTNYQDAYSRIVDADIAQESAELVRLQILQQAGTAVVAHKQINNLLLPFNCLAVDVSHSLDSP